jgi:cell division transport system ATP-binding protein
MIVVRNVTVRHANGMEALSRVHLHVKRGEFAFLVGSTGSGKSTLLKLLYRELAPTEGSVLVDGTDVTQLPRREIPLLRRRLGVVFQDFRLLPYKTARENVAYALQVIGAEPRSLHRLSMAALSRVGLAQRASAMPDELSGGEQQRVCLARALVNDPLVLLADEPTGNLDPESSRDVIGTLEAINAAGTTVLVATHDRDIVNLLGKRVIELDHGRVARDEAEGQYDRTAAIEDLLPASAPLASAPLSGREGMDEGERDADA